MTVRVGPSCRYCRTNKFSCVWPVWICPKCWTMVPLFFSPSFPPLTSQLIILFSSISIECSAITEPRAHLWFEYPYYFPSNIICDIRKGYIPFTKLHKKLGVHLKFCAFNFFVGAFSVRGTSISPVTRETRVRFPPWPNKFCHLREVLIAL